MTQYEHFKEFENTVFMNTTFENSTIIIFRITALLVKKKRELQCLVNHPVYSNLHKAMLILTVSHSR